MKEKTHPGRGKKKGRGAISLSKKNICQGKEKGFQRGGQILEILEKLSYFLSTLSLILTAIGVRGGGDFLFSHGEISREKKLNKFLYGLEKTRKKGMG